MKKRDHLEMRMDVLRAIREESKPTCVMYKSGTSWKPLWVILKDLSESGLIKLVKTEKPSGRCKVECELTAKGRQVLENYKQLIELMVGQVS